MGLMKAGGCAEQWVDGRSEVDVVPSCGGGEKAYVAIAKPYKDVVYRLFFFNPNHDTIVDA